MKSCRWLITTVWLPYGLYSTIILLGTIFCRTGIIISLLIYLEEIFFTLENFSKFNFSPEMGIEEIVQMKICSQISIRRILLIKLFIKKLLIQKKVIKTAPVGQLYKG